MAHIRNNGTFAGGPLDIFVPIVKNALSELYPNGTKGASLCEITKDIEDRFGISIPNPVMHTIMKKIANSVNTINKKEDMTIFDDGGFIIQQFIFEGYKEKIQSSKEEVEKILKLFKEFCKIYNYDTTTNEVDIVKFIEQNRADISYYLAHEQKETTSNNIAALFVEICRKTPQVYEILRHLYLGSMLTSYLSYQPQEAKMGVELLLDTNFIVSLLDLNTPESTKTCNIFMEASKSLGYNFTILKDTIEEFQGLLTYKAQNLNQAILAKSLNKEDIYNACDRCKLTCTDLERIADNIENTLTKNFNINIVHNTDNLKNKARFSKEYDAFLKIRSSEKSALHDAIAVQYVKEKRGNKIIYDFNKVNCWFVNNSISHYNQNSEEFERLQASKGAQPEIIKVDNLLNILWLSNPSIGIINNDFIDMGIASMVSYTLNSTLPNVRIIKELDENIQKYRNDYNITDKDVVRLSTRIVQRQIEDLQSLNEIAKKDGVKFAAKVKEESIKQEQLESARFQKLDMLMNSMIEGIGDLQQNKDKLVQRYNDKMKELNIKEKEISEKEKKLMAFWTIENKRRNEKWELYKDKLFKQKQKMWKYILIFSGILLFVTILILNTILSNKLISTILSFILLLFGKIIITNYNNWCHNPNYEEKFKSNLKKPNDLQEIPYNDSIKC